MDAAVRPQCAWCADPLSVPIERLTVVHGSGGETLPTCGADCLVELVRALAGRPEEVRPALAGRRN